MIVIGNRRVFILLIAVLLGSCKPYKIYDRNLSYPNYAPSYIVNTRDRYCLLLDENKSNTKNYNVIEVNNQVNLLLKEFGIKIYEEVLLETSLKSEIKKDKIIKRERNNNFKNCDYLIDYELSTSKNFPTNACFYWIITDIKTNNTIGKYYICRDTYRKSKQKEYIEASIKKWWEFQNSNKKREFTMYNCNNGKCVTRECDKDKCIVK